MTIIPIFIPKESKPVWEFDGEWTAEDKAVIDTVFHKHSYKHKKPYRNNWSLICRGFKEDAEYHACYA